jgi:hypothetical protein
MNRMSVIQPETHCQKWIPKNLFLLYNRGGVNVTGFIREVTMAFMASSRS